jgi:hypothetical protein
MLQVLVGLSYILIPESHISIFLMVRVKNLQDWPFLKEGGYSSAHISGSGRRLTMNNQQETKASLSWSGSGDCFCLDPSITLWAPQRLHVLLPIVL